MEPTLEALKAKVAKLEAENRTLKLLVDVANDEKNHWHDWYKRRNRWAQMWRALATKQHRK